MEHVRQRSAAASDELAAQARTLYDIVEQLSAMVSGRSQNGKNPLPECVAGENGWRTGAVEPPTGVHPTGRHHAAHSAAVLASFRRSSLNQVCQMEVREAVDSARLRRADSCRTW